MSILQLKDTHGLGNEERILFENNMFEHSKYFASKFYNFNGDHQIHIATRLAIKHAYKYGLNGFDSVKLYIEMVYIFGSDFDTDPQYPALNRILANSNSSGGQINKSRKLTCEILKYIANVIGNDDLKYNHSLIKIKKLLNKPLNCTLVNYKSEIIKALTLIYPQKMNTLSDERLCQLINTCYIEAHRYNISTIEGVTLLLINMLYFGHGCLSDPLYPWISQVLNDVKIVNKKTRIKRLKKSTIKWINFIT